MFFKWVSSQRKIPLFVLQWISSQRKVPLLIFRWMICHRKIPLILLQIILALSSVLIANEKQIPVVSNMIYNNSNSLKEGFNKVCGLPIKVESVTERYRRLVEGDLKLYPGDKGFTELSDFILEDLRRPQSEYFAKTWSGQMSFEEFKQRAVRDRFSKMTYQGIRGNRGGMNIPFGNNRINVYLNNSSNEKTDYAAFFVYKLEQGIEKEHRRITLTWALGLAITTSLIQILQFDWRSAQAPTHIRP